jgi:hypothetical protein
VVASSFPRSPVRPGGLSILPACDRRKLID